MKMRNFLLITMLICTVAWQNASAESNLGFKGVGVRAGMVDPEGVGTTLGFGAFVDLGTVAPQFQLEAVGDYWSQTEEFFGVSSANIRDISVGARGKYLIPVRNTKIQPYVGSGLGLHFLRAKVSIDDQLIGGFLVQGSSAEETTTNLGLDVGGGASAPMSTKTDILGEMWYGILSDVSQFSLKVGVRYNFGE